MLKFMGYFKNIDDRELINESFPPVIGGKANCGGSKIGVPRFNTIDNLILNTIFRR
jgi:hypothetical protein